MNQTTLETPHTEGSQQVERGSCRAFGEPQFLGEEARREPRPTKRKRGRKPGVAERLNAFKRTHGLWAVRTLGPKEDRWVAIALDTAHRLLSRCSLTPLQKASPVALLAGYGRVLEEAGLIQTGHSQAGALARLARTLKLEFPELP